MVLAAGENNAGPIQPPDKRKVFPCFPDRIVDRIYAFRNPEPRDTIFDRLHSAERPITSPGRTPGVDTPAASRRWIPALQHPVDYDRLSCRPTS